MIDISQEIPQDWFYELEQSEYPNKKDLESICYDLYQSNCIELLGNMQLELFLSKVDGFYYMLMKMSQPIGDYGTTWVGYWYKCERQYISKIKAILENTDKGIVGGQMSLGGDDY